MPLFDERGRIFGRVNIIDAAIVAFLVVLLPILYTAQRLFRVPKTEIERVEPATQLAGAGRRVRVHGRNLRPFMKVLVSPTGRPFSIYDETPGNQAGNILLDTASGGEVRLPNLDAGAYDLHLFDSTREVARLDHAFTLTAPSPSDGTIHARVRFVVPSELRRLVHEGDVEVAERAAPGAGEQAPPARLTRVRVISDKLPAGVEFGEGWASELIEADMEMPGRKNSRGEWEYRSQICRVGERIAFQTTTYSMRGMIGEMHVTANQNGAGAK